jgi:hypothetical protein
VAGLRLGAHQIDNILCKVGVKFACVALRAIGAVCTVCCHCENGIGVQCKKLTQLIRGVFEEAGKARRGNVQFKPLLERAGPLQLIAYLGAKPTRAAGHATIGT